MTTKNQEDPRILYSYTTDSLHLEHENRLLRETVNHLNNELSRFHQVPLMIADVKELVHNQAVIKIPNGNIFLVNIAPECEPIVSGDTVAVEQKNLTVLQKMNKGKRFNVEQHVIMEKPNMAWSSIGGLNQEVNELREVIELPLKKPELFAQIGITPAKGVLLYGPPGTGKTLMAKAVAASTDSTFLEIVGSELVQKFIGEGAKLVKELFDLAREKAPSIIFIDEIDALAANRIEIGTSGEREVQRTFMQFLAELDGFKSLGNIKVIGATNRIDILDPAILRPGRLDRLIYVPVPNEEGILEILKIHTKEMPMEKSLKLQDLSPLMRDLSGAEVKAICTEAGYFAIREDRTVVHKNDFVEAIKKVRGEEEDTEHLSMFG